MTTPPAGSALGERATGRLFRTDKARDRLAWAGRQIRKRTWVIVIARFIPGGRTAATFAAGALGLTWGRYTAYDVPGCILWAIYAAMLGYLGGETFKDSLWKPAAASLAAATLVTLAAEGYRRAVERQERSSSA